MKKDIIRDEKGYYKLDEKTKKTEMQIKSLFCEPHKNMLQSNTFRAPPPSEK